MAIDFLDKYEYREIEDGCFLLELTPVENYPEICVCIDKKDDIITIFDGGSLMAVLGMVYNFSSKEVIDKFIEICKSNKVSSKNNVLFLECTKENFDERLQDFIKALNEICHI